MKPSRLAVTSARASWGIEMDGDGAPAAARSPSGLTLFLGGLAAFGAYFAMYAFRKPFAAATYADVAGWHLAIDYKTALLIAQVIGYALSKLIGVRVISETGRRGRARTILALIGASWIALILFALVPAPWNVACLFLNGLPLGLIWGLVFSYVEGRRVSELLGSMLCASFILSSGVVKSVAMLLMDAGVAEHWMPAATGLVFVPLLLAALWQLERLPPPDACDEAERTVRVPMLAADRAAFLRAHGATLVMLVLGYVLLTALRDVRDNFATELWSALGYGGAAAVFSTSELPVALLTLGALALLMLIRDNLRALLAMHGLILLGALCLGLSTLAFQAGMLAPLPWMIVTGAGLYLAYTPFNAMLFDRMIATIGTAANAGFLIYIADASGYVGSVALLLVHSLGTPEVQWLPFFMVCCYVTAMSVGLLTLLSALHFLRTDADRRVPLRRAGYSV
jgi:MFS family permease